MLSNLRLKSMGADKSPAAREVSSLQVLVGLYLNVNFRKRKKNQIEKKTLNTFIQKLLLLNPIKFWFFKVPRNDTVRLKRCVACAFACLRNCCLRKIFLSAFS